MYYHKKYGSGKYENSYTLKFKLKKFLLTCKKKSLFEYKYDTIEINL